jgi:hypothetical protein
VPAPEIEAIVRLARSGQPVALLGSAAGGIAPSIAGLAGLKGTFDATPARVVPCRADNRAPALVKTADTSFDSFCYPQQVIAIPSARVIYEASGVPELTLDSAGGRQVAFWNPPDMRSAEGEPLSGIWGNTGDPYALAAGVFNEMLKSRATVRAAQIDQRQTVSLTAWRTASGDVRILTANLEEGLRDDADLSRHAVLEVPTSWGATQWKDLWTGRDLPIQGLALSVDLPQAASMLIEGLR